MMEKGNVVKTKFSGKKTFESYIGDYWEAKTALTWCYIKTNESFSLVFFRTVIQFRINILL